VFKTLYLDAC